MPQICICKDIPRSARLRQTWTPAHLEYIETIMDRILVAGPVSSSPSGDYLASCFIYHTDSRSEALELLHNDPYFKAGLYAEVECRYFKPAAGSWIGGKIW